MRSTSRRSIRVKIRTDHEAADRSPAEPLGRCVHGAAGARSAVTSRLCIDARRPPVGQGPVFGLSVEASFLSRLAYPSAARYERGRGTAVDQLVQYRTRI